MYSIGGAGLYMDMLCSQLVSTYFVSCTRSSHRVTIRKSSDLLPDRPTLPTLQSSKSPNRPLILGSATPHYELHIGKLLSDAVPAQTLSPKPMNTWCSELDPNLAVDAEGAESGGKK